MWEFLFDSDFFLNTKDEKTVTARIQARDDDNNTLAKR
jgi:hypothetical protein